MLNTKIISGYYVLYAKDDLLYAAKGYRIFKSMDNGDTWVKDGYLQDLKYGLIANFNRLLSRLFRAQVTNLIVLEDGTRIAAAKKGIFVAQKNETTYKKTFEITRGNRPMNFCEDKNHNIYFGEYFSNRNRDEVYIYKSEDFGKSWKVCYTFPKGSIRHVHGIFYDEYEDSIWFTTGDFDEECIIGNTKDEFKTINIFKQGAQKYRAVVLLFFKDFIVYGTDTEHEKNYIYKLNRADGKETCLNELQGSVFAGAYYKNYAVLSTTVEPSQVNKDNYSYIWFSENGTKWNSIFKGEKDFFDPKYFQYGNFKFPVGAVNENRILFTGNSLKGFDNNTVIYTFDKIDKKAFL